MKGDIIPPDDQFHDRRHIHKYFAFQTKKDFEPTYTESFAEPVYRMVEYVYSACQCGAAVKTEVKKK